MDLPLLSPAPWIGQPPRIGSLVRGGTVLLERGDEQTEMQAVIDLAWHFRWIIVINKAQSSEIVENDDYRRVPTYFGGIVGAASGKTAKKEVTSDIVL